MTKEELFDKLRVVIAEELGFSEQDRGKITLDTDIVADLEADELDVMECLVAIEEEFHLEIPADDVEKYELLPTKFKMSSAVDYLYGKLFPEKVEKQTKEAVSDEGRRNIAIHFKNECMEGFLDKEEWPTCNLDEIMYFKSKEDAEKCIQSILDMRHNQLHLTDVKDPKFTIVRISRI